VLKVAICIVISRLKLYYTLSLTLIEITVEGTIMRKKQYTLTELNALSHEEIHQLAIHDYGKLLRVKNRRKLTTNELILFNKQKLTLKLYEIAEKELSLSKS